MQGPGSCSVTSRFADGSEQGTGCMKSSVYRRRACADVYGSLTKDKTIATLTLLLASRAALQGYLGPSVCVGPAGRAVLARFRSTASRSSFSRAVEIPSAATGMGTGEPS